MYQIVYARAELKNIPKIKSAHLDGKVKALLKVIRENPFKVPPSYEKLVGDLKGMYFQRISIQHRLLYEVFE